MLAAQGITAETAPTKGVEDHGASGLAAGEIVGIVFGVLILLAMLVVGGFFAWR